jgi:hypothetical protein
MLWKENWEEVREHHRRWWARDGLVVVVHVPPDVAGPRPPRDPRAIEPHPPRSPLERHADPAYVTAASHWWAASSALSLDTLPIGRVELGPGSLSLHLGSEPEFADDTVWFHPIRDEDEIEKPLRLNRGNPWWTRQFELIDAALARAAGRYPVGCPDLIENMDILSSLRGSQMLMIDLLERPEWVVGKIAEVNAAYFEAYDAIRDRIASPDGSCCFWAFHLWGPGRTAKVQCDAGAMISAPMFDAFVRPSLAEQCDWLDCAMFHLDGTQAVQHLPTLLDIPGLDAIEYTPQAGVEGGGHERWWPMYRRILGAGKSVQVVGVRPAEVGPLLNAIGTRGVCVHVEGIASEAQLRELERTVGARYPK